MSLDRVSLWPSGLVCVPGVAEDDTVAWAAERWEDDAGDAGEEAVCWFSHRKRDAHISSDGLWDGNMKGSSASNWMFHSLTLLESTWSLPSIYFISSCRFSAPHGQFHETLLRMFISISHRMRKDSEAVTYIIYIIWMQVATAGELFLCHKINNQIKVKYHIINKGVLHVVTLNILSILLLVVMLKKTGNGFMWCYCSYIY